MYECGGLLSSYLVISPFHNSSHIIPSPCSSGIDKGIFCSEPNAHGCMYYHFCLREIVPVTFSTITWEINCSLSHRTNSRLYERTTRGQIRRRHISMDDMILKLRLYKLWITSSSMTQAS
jgi:hypothetical protein